MTCLKDKLVSAAFHITVSNLLLEKYLDSSAEILFFYEPAKLNW